MLQLFKMGGTLKNKNTLIKYFKEILITYNNYIIISKSYIQHYVYTNV